VRGRLIDGRRQQQLLPAATAAAAAGRLQQRRRWRRRRRQSIPGAAARGQRQGKEKNAEVGTYPRPQGYRKDVRFTAGVTQNPQMGVYFEKFSHPVSHFKADFICTQHPKIFISYNSQFYFFLLALDNNMVT
jgi:hypothetical protein